MAASQEKPLSGHKRKKGVATILWAVWLACLTARGVAGSGDDPPLKCEDLRVGQYPEPVKRQRTWLPCLYLFPLINQTYICEDPKIDNDTQEPLRCTNHTAYVACLPAPNITCKDFNGNETQFTGREIGFYKPIQCRNVNGYSYKVAVALSLFLGWLGADRFYLGYPALGEYFSFFF
ncbi:hypothetical protein lerEdw1_011734 [Lerista edwardsae]|nr:hypothetical protein lerEdw1_011734 [Lerista edwardsae]